MSTDAYAALTTEGQPGRPIVVGLHGTGGNERQFFGLLQELVPGAAIVSPRGDVDEAGALRFFRRKSEGVYDMVDLARATEKMAGFLASYRSRHPDAEIWAMGYSNGANILASVLLASPDLIDRAALLHPLVPWTPDPQPGLSGRSVLVTAGRRDPIGPWSGTAALIDYLRSQGARVQTEIHDGGHELRGSEIDALAGFFREPTVP